MDQPHMLTFDVEEYFQVEAAGIPQSWWGRFPGRLDAPMERILEMLGRRSMRATFFVLGWVAKRQPKLVEAIAANGHEVASHGMTHSMIGRLTPAQFRAELDDSRKLLEDIAGTPVRGFRAPTFSVTRATAWAIDVLAEAGYCYDSSVFPIRHDRYGVPDAPRDMHLARGPGGGTVIEIPPLTARLLGVNWPMAGGGYLRLLPCRLIERAIRAAAGCGRRAMIYLHPWELDADQPALPMGMMANWRHRVNLRRAESKLARLMDTFRFTSVREAIRCEPADPPTTFDYH